MNGLCPGRFLDSGDVDALFAAAGGVVVISPEARGPEPDLPAGDVRRAAHVRRRPCRPGRHVGEAADRMAEARSAARQCPRRDLPWHRVRPQ